MATPCVEVWQTSNLRRLRLGEEKRRKKEERTNHSMKILWSALFHRATITTEMLRRNGPLIKSEESVLRPERSLWWERFVKEVGLEPGALFVAMVQARNNNNLKGCSPVLNVMSVCWGSRVEGPGDGQWGPAAKPRWEVWGTQYPIS